MAIRLPNDDLALTEVEQAEAACEYGAHWKDMDRPARTYATLSYLRQHPDRHPDYKAPPVAEPSPPARSTSGGELITMSHLEAFSVLLLDRIDAKCAAVESQFSTLLADVLAASEAVRKQAGSTDGAKDLAGMRESMVSIERRVSRHAEHLARIESKMQKIERSE